MKITKAQQKAILADARDIASTGQAANVTLLCRMHLGTDDRYERKKISALLDANNIPRRTASQGHATSQSDFGAKYEALSRVFVEVSKPSSDIDLFLVERAKAGNARALEILKKLVG